MNNDQLTHSGIKGMKWGIRRYQNKDGSLTPEGRARYSEDAIRARELSKKSIDQLSTKELYEVTNRLRAEQQYKELTKTESVGKKALNTFIKTAKTLNEVDEAVSTYGKLAYKGYGKYTAYKSKDWKELFSGNGQGGKKKKKNK